MDEVFELRKERNKFLSTKRNSLFLKSVRMEKSLGVFFSDCGVPLTLYEQASGRIKLLEI